MDTDYEFQSKPGSHENPDRPWDRDAAQLTRLGKTPVLKRNFGFMSLLGFSCTVLVTWEGTLLTFQLLYAKYGVKRYEAGSLVF